MKIINYVIKKNNYDKETIEKMEYAFKSLFLSLPKLVVIMIVTLFLGIFREVVLLIIFSKIIRYFSFGYHARGSKECIILSLIIFVLMPLIFLKSNILLENRVLLFTISILNFILFAPCDTKKRRLNNPQKRMIRKILVILISTIYFLLTFIVDIYLSKILLLSIIIIVLLTNPIIYLITGEPYRKEETCLVQ